MSGTVWLLPIEPFEWRYTADWYRWWPEELRQCGWRVEVIDGGSGYQAIEQGQFLDCVQTWRWKGMQVAALADLWADIAPGDIILNLDGWGPATTAALYMRDTTGKQVKVAAFMHAGTWDPQDFLAQRGLGYWAAQVEAGWAAGLDLILCGSSHAAGLIRVASGLCARIVVTGCPIHCKPLLWAARPWNARPLRVVFPHRLAPEKAPGAFAEISARYASAYPDDAVEWVRTADVVRDKQAYYELLGSSRVAVSTAYQETFGIAMQEAAALGCHLVAPYRLSYPETLRGSHDMLYEGLDAAVSAIHSTLHAPCRSAWDGYHEKAILRASRALEHLL